MNLSAYGLNLQISKTTLEYEAKLNKIDKNESEFTELLEDKEPKEEYETLPIVNSNYLISDEETLSKEEKIKKNVLEHVLGGFNLDAKSIKLIPNEAFNFSYEQKSVNPYETRVTQGPNGFSYISNEEYYEKTNIDFSGKVLIETQDGEQFEIELNFSYTKEFYEKNTIEIAAMEKHIQNNPLKLDSQEYEDSLKQLNSISLLFDILKEHEEKENKTLFDYLKEQFLKNQKLLDDDKTKSEKNFLVDDFKVSIKNKEEKFDLLVVQKDGIGIYLSSYEKSSFSFELEHQNNASLMKATYSYEEINTYKNTKKE